MKKYVQGKIYEQHLASVVDGVLKLNLKRKKNEKKDQYILDPSFKNGNMRLSLAAPLILHWIRNYM